MTQLSEATLTQYWYVETASVRGVVHDQKSTPIQDDIKVEANLFDENGPVMLAVADGHGSPIHFRSAVGAHIATNVAVEALKQHLVDIDGAKNVRQVSEILDSVIIDSIISAWQKAVKEHYLEFDLSEKETDFLSRQKREFSEIVYYGTTLISSCIYKNWVMLFQIGDGDAVVKYADNKIEKPIPGDFSLVGNYTTSLCQPNPKESFRYKVIDLSLNPIDIIFIASDGFGNSQRIVDWHEHVLSDIDKFIVQFGLSWVKDHVPLWAAKCASLEGSADDTTIGLIISERVTGEK
jgi:hypothetical protein